MKCLPGIQEGLGVVPSRGSGRERTEGNGRGGGKGTLE